MQTKGRECANTHGQPGDERQFTTRLNHDSTRKDGRQMTPQTLPEILPRDMVQDLLDAGIYRSESGRWDGAEVGWLVPTQPGWPRYILRTLDWRKTIH